MGFQGDLDTFGLATIFQTLTANQQSGTLHVYDNKSERFLVFSQGSIRCVSSGERQNISLGEILVAGGKIDESILASALTRQAENHEPLGKILVAMGACRQKDIEAALRFQMEEEIFDLFTWKGAKFEFDEKRSGDTLVGADIRISHVSVNTSGILLEAMRRIDEWERLSKFIPSMDIIPLIPEENQTADFLAGFTAEEKRIISFVDGINNIDSIRRKSCLGRYAVTQLLARLFEEGRCREATIREMQVNAENMILQGDPGAAVDLYRRILSLEPDDVNCRQAFATSLEAVGKNHAAAEEQSRVAEMLCARHDFSGAAVACARADNLQPDNHKIMERLASLYILAGQPREAAQVWIRLVRSLERKGDITRALEYLSGALEDLPDNNDLRRMQARMLLAQGETAGAVAAYERLAMDLQTQGDNAGAVTALRNIIRIDRTRTDLEDRILRLQMTESQKKQKRVGSIIGAGIAILLLCMLVGAGINEILLRRHIRRALAQAKTLQQKAAGLDAVSRKARLEAAMAALEDARPRFCLLAEPEASRLAAIGALGLELDEADKAVTELLMDQQRVIDEWTRLRLKNTPEADKARQAFIALLESKPETEIVNKAADLYAEWSRKQDKVKRALTELLAIVGNKGLEADKRFGALRKLAKQFPETLDRHMPNGPLGLTLPVMITTRSDTGARLPARIIIDSKPWPRRTPCVAEVPCDAKVPVGLQRRGFGNAQGLTPLMRGKIPMPAYTVKLRRHERWKFRTQGAIEAAPIFARDGRTVYAANTRGQILAVDTNTGNIRWPRPSTTLVVPGIYKTGLLLAGDKLFALDQGGRISCLLAASGRIIWPRNNGAILPAGKIVAYSADLVTLSSLKHEMQLGQPLDLVITANADSPVYAVDAVTGKLLWPANAIKRKVLRDRIHRIVAGPLPLPAQQSLLFFDNHGKLHVLLEDGTYGGTKTIITGRVDGIPLLLRQSARALIFLVAEEGRGISCFVADPASPLTAKLKWRNPDFRDESVTAPFLADQSHVFAGFASGRVVRLNLEDGKMDIGWDLQGLPGAVTGPMVRRGQRLLLTCAAAADQPAYLIGVQLAPDRIAGMAWRYSLGHVDSLSGVSIFSPGNGRPGTMVIGAGNNLFCLDDEDL